MNQNVSKIFFVFVGVILGLVGTVQILTGGWNAISNLYKYGMIAVTIGSFLSPRWGAFFLIIACGYMDLFKRFLVIAGNVYTVDLIYIVGLPPLVALCTYAGSLIKFLLNPVKEERFVRLLLVSLAVSVAMAGLMVAEKGTGFGSLQFIAVGAGFVGLIFVVPYNFRTIDEIAKMMKRIILFLTPVALYAFWQNIFGLSDFEVLYLETRDRPQHRVSNFEWSGLPFLLDAKLIAELG